MPPELILGIDLAGPSNARDTAMVLAESDATVLQVVESRCGLSDADICQLVRARSGRSCVIALDAPLSYNDGGGDRPGDSDLRRQVIRAGLASGSVMPPTMNRMAYLTLRGIAVARLAEASGGCARAG